MPGLNPIVWVDLETGGLEPLRHQVTQIAAIATAGLLTLDELGEPFERKITLVSGRYTNEALEIQNYNKTTWDEDAIPIDMALRELVDWINPYTHTRTSKAGRKYDAADVGGYNVFFDCDFLGKTAKRNKIWLPIATWTGGMLDVLQLAKWTCLLTGEEPENYQLATVYEFFGLGKFNAHDAGDDIAATVKLARALMMGW